ncbi:MAG: amidohydrolase [Microcystis panniformis Mp_MB_F_20051200_S9]|uniref:Amidohydrolase n=1 Tax=Microcystis panniformis Mp_MB_F_20051200_S9 TaxID=2486223 RepID=A0A552Q1D5_9CHRO|nr:MAG: amidohydrolase [Microcystis panniformis Mp_MB_F_20080800_S26D]TRV48715.1 MAG: amidohydrolase [Microcystis panniformis Mp_GB_SS_20050300_S99]TRV54744.1 MAG: amidohydrolase [Microcystis panniformis Mp_GB_SS_20050300_S99D]TRV60894.1 MAG: amidohydrolase [Microcystis panniformis Mp_MB_F_20051200_S9D]TRV62059.1 MAG: amidohydrolase [Microcystis panniformis Mp_MB_F_20080800_S26]TRV63026.1 MAG: amidohydrolase [Microcystis panniformis Mp_MB_F_20051200_S9]TRV67808.1 MAG: amidohydrolase [Microcys
MISSFPVPNSLNCPQIRLAIRSLQPQLVHWRRQIHQKPELGFQEHLTASLISQTLTKYRIDHQTGIADTGIVATIAGSQPGPVLALRADMDALPIAEANQVPYCSQHPGQMHACGHDGHTAIALGTAVYLAQNRHHVKGTVKIIFQPAEEGPGGAKPMIEAGVLKNPDVDGIIGLHLWNNLPLGTVGVKNGPLMAAVESFDLQIQGRGGHGAIPHQTVDSILVAAQIVNALQTIVARNLNPLDAAVVTVGKLAAGTARNVIADSANLSGTVRYFNPQLGGYFRQRMEEIIAGICQSQGASYQFDYWQLYPPVINHDQMAELVRSIAAQVVETPAGIVPECQTMGGEDMSFFLQEVPGCYFFLGSANPELGLAYPHHHPRFDFDESVLTMGVEIFVRCVEKFGNSKTF